MPFREVPAKVDFVAQEHEILRFWAETNAFYKLVEKNRGVFPAGITGNPVRKIGYFGWQTWELSFDDFRLPASA
ncbi:MAG: hypothetical protein M1283_03425, partial [Gammaproteobacteria bacterium]|nr:hypothetical protein [Gammaproteobacteria bacterium]